MGGNPINFIDPTGLISCNYLLDDPDAYFNCLLSDLPFDKFIDETIEDCKEFAACTFECTAAWAGVKASEHVAENALEKAEKVISSPSLKKATKILTKPFILLNIKNNVTGLKCLVVAACKHNHRDSQTSPFWAQIICKYKDALTHNK